MRGHQADKAERPDGQGGDGTHQRDENEQQAAATAHGKAEAARDGFAERQQFQGFAAEEGGGEQHEGEEDEQRCGVRAGVVGAAGKPAQDALQLRVAAELDDGHHALHQRGNGNAGHQQPRRLQAAREPQYQYGDHQRPARAREQQAAAAQRGKGEKGGDDGERYAGADAEHFRAGHRIACQRLQQHTGAGEHDADRHRTQTARQAVVKNQLALPMPAPAVRPGGKSLRQHEQRQQHGEAEQRCAPGSEAR